VRRTRLDFWIARHRRTSGTSFAKIQGPQAAALRAAMNNDLNEFGQRDSLLLSDLKPA
jgi:hypothetical protein